MANVVLIGMPGCGKSTLGVLLVLLTASLLVLDLKKKDRK